MSKQDRNGCVGVPPKGNDAYACKCLSHRQDYFKSHVVEAVRQAFLEHMHHDIEVEAIKFSGHVKRFHDEGGTVIGTVAEVGCTMSLQEFGLTAWVELDH
ncbi:hypothetical protein [Nocardiopsis sp. HUAS JQ3]|uniref:hypothetical protein n=1 Tax=Nocardiopsis sp. HUAS JQ3 TaxID=3061629 RepID=UPI0023A9426E|nr:hypothetical protein [Nocardiopsis sp. HUAS JQ3]WDZ91186.1 hypothetical protein PV789_00995 [Nocardiopsis sp. HUAS JQ3]